MRTHDAVLRYGRSGVAAVALVSMFLSVGALQSASAGPAGDLDPLRLYVLERSSDDFLGRARWLQLAQADAEPVSAVPVAGGQPRTVASETGGEPGPSAWSDVTSVFRFPRWKHPFAVGGPLCWLSVGSWREEPWRTTNVLVGEVILAGLIYGAVELAEDDDDDCGTCGATATATTQAGSGGGGGSNNDPPPTDFDPVDPGTPPDGP